MNGIGAAALEVQDVLLRIEVPFCVIGGLAAIYWGTPRATQDVDLSALVPLGAERTTAERILKYLAPRMEAAAAFAAENRVLLVVATNGTPIDIAFAAFPIEQRFIERAAMRQLQPDLELRLISAEDLIVSKAIAGRPRDWDDIAGIIDRQSSQLDRSLIERELRQLCDLIEDVEPLEKLLPLLR